MFTNLKQYGWNKFFEKQFQLIHLENDKLVPGRVISVHRTSYEIVTNDGEIMAEITGNRLKDEDVYSKPVVGDWVVLELGTQEHAHIIIDILKRQSILKRRRAHSETEVQIMASNVDTAVIVQSLAHGFSIARIERVLVQLEKSHIKAIVILNKIDVAKNLEQVMIDIKKLDADIPVIFTSYTTGQGIEEMKKALRPQKTIIFIGSSGVGKSSLINTMLDTDSQQKTGEVSDYSGKGKHTTTARRLFVLDSGVIVIDTPGTREFGLTADGTEEIKNIFSKIEKIALLCKFRDCKHLSEPGCAVKKAIVGKTIDQSMLDTYHTLLKEIQ